MKTTIEIETSDLLTINEAERVINLLKFNYINREKDLDRKVVEWAEQFFNPKHKKPRFGEEFEKKRLLENFKKIMHEYIPMHHFEDKLENWTYSERLIFLRVGSTKLKIETRN